MVLTGSCSVPFPVSSEPLSDTYRGGPGHQITISIGRFSVHDPSLLFSEDSAIVSNYYTLCNAQEGLQSTGTSAEWWLFFFIIWLASGYTTWTTVAS